MSEPADIDDLAMLAEFAQLAMDRARAASRRAEAGEAEGGDPAPHLIAFDRMGRAVRLALSLRRRFAGEARAEAVQRVQARKERLRAALSPAIRIHADFRDRQDLEWALVHRLETEAEAFASIPFDVGVTRLSKVLGLPAFARHDADPGDAVGFNPLAAFGGAPPEGEHLDSLDPPPGRSPIEGEVDRPPGPSRRGLQPTALAMGDHPQAEGLAAHHIANARHVVAEATGPP